MDNMENMDDALRAARLRGQLRRHMNGAVVEDMKNCGMTGYASNWGVSLPEIRRIACELAYDHDFARFLYGQGLRELLLSAYIIADPKAVTAEELDFWGAGVVNAELAENLSFSLLMHTGLVSPIIDKWLKGEVPELLRYCALLTLARMSVAGKLSDGERSEALQLAQKFAGDGSLLVSSAARSLQERLTEEDDI